MKKNSTREQNHCQDISGVHIHKCTGCRLNSPGAESRLWRSFPAPAPTGVPGPARQLRPSSGLCPTPGPNQTISFPSKAEGKDKTRTGFPAGAAAHSRGRGNSARVPECGVAGSWSETGRAHGVAPTGRAPQTGVPLSRQRTGCGEASEAGRRRKAHGAWKPSAAPRAPEASWSRGPRPRRPRPSGFVGAPRPPGPSFRRRFSLPRSPPRLLPPPARGRTHVDRVDVGFVEEAERCAQLQGWGDEVVPGLQLQVPVSRTEGKELLAAQAAPGPRQQQLQQQRQRPRSLAPADCGQHVAGLLSRKPRGRRPEAEEGGDVTGRPSATPPRLRSPEVPTPGNRGGEGNRGEMERGPAPSTGRAAEATQWP